MCGHHGLAVQLGRDQAELAGVPPHERRGVGRDDAVLLEAGVLDTHLVAAAGEQQHSRTGAS
jgi:hypothetical protein